MVFIGCGAELTIEHSSHHRYQRTAGVEEGNRGIGHAEPSSRDPRLQVAPRAATERPSHDSVRGVKPHEQPGEAWVGVGLSDEVPVRDGYDLGRIGELVRQRIDDLPLYLERLAEDGLDEFLLRREVVVKGAEADVGFLRDLGNRGRLDALAGEQRARRLEQARPRLGATPRSSRRGLLSIGASGHG